MSYKLAEKLHIGDGEEVYKQDRVVSQRDGKASDRKISKRIPLSQAFPSASAMQIYTKALKQVPADFFMTSGSAYTDVIPKRAFRVCKEVTLEISVDIKTAAARLAPVNNWFSRIEIKQDSEVLTSIYPDYLQIGLSLTGGSAKGGCKHHGKTRKPKIERIFEFFLIRGVDVFANIQVNMICICPYGLTRST